MTSAPAKPSGHPETAYGPHLRGEFLLEDGAVYLNHGSYGATPKSVIAAQRRWQERLEAEPSRFMEREFRPALRVAAERLSPFLGVPGETLALVENATLAVNTVLRSIAFKPGDQILLTDQTYNAVKNAARYRAEETGAEIHWVDLPSPVQSHEQILESYRGGLSDRVKVAIIDHVVSPTALVLPVREMTAAAKKAGAFVLVDGAHAPGMLDLDLPGIGADWYTGNCHKWLFTPKGCAFLWAHERVRDGMHPSTISHGYEQGFLAEFDWVGTRDASAQHCLPDAIDFRDRHGGDAIQAHNHDLVVRAAHLLADTWKTAIGAPDGLFGSMATIRLPSGFGTGLKAAQELRRRLLDEYRIKVPVNDLNGALWVRISAQMYNGLDEYERLADAILIERKNLS